MGGAAWASQSGGPSVQRWNKLGPIMPCTADKDWDHCPSAPHVIRVGNGLRMYYMSIEGERRRVGLAEADVSDPLAWRKVSDRPLLDFGKPGSIDSHWVSYPWVVPVTATHWHLYYATWNGAYLPGPGRRKLWGTSLAESDDAGRTWTRTGGPLFDRGRPFACDEHGTGSCAVLPVGAEYWMWYTAISRPAPDHHKISIALAVSTDEGHTFERHPAGALLNLPPPIGKVGTTCSKPFVEFSGGRYRMWFSCAKDGDHYRIHYAESADGIRFKWWPEPVLDVSASGWDQEMTCYPSVLRLGQRTLMYYDGNQYAGIGVAEQREAD